MGVTPDPTREGWYTLDVSHGRKSRERISFKGSYDEAQKEYWRLKNKKSKVIGLRTRIGDLIGDFVDWYKLEKSKDTIKDFWYAWKRLEPHFANLHIHHLDTAEIDRYKGKRLEDTYLPGKPNQAPGNDTEAERLRRKPISKRTITRELAYLSAICKWAKEKGYVAEEIKVKGFPKKQTRAPIQTTHTFAEVQNILQKTKESARNGADRYGLTLLMYDAGLRKKEARLLTAERIDLPAEPVIMSEALPPYYGSITVVRKGGKEARLPILTLRLYLELQARKKEVKRGYLYLNPTTKRPYVDIREGLKGAAKRAGVDKRITHHLLRHDFATHLHQSGADLKTIQGLLSHEDIQTTMNIYAHLEHGQMAARAGDFAARIARSEESGGNRGENEP